MEQKQIPVHIESENGHDTKLVSSPEEAADEAKKQLKDGKWVTVEKEDGSTETLTSKDLPIEEGDDDLDEEDKALMQQAKGADWNNVFTTQTAEKVKKMPAKPIKSATSKKFEQKFEKVKSITSTKTVKGG